MDITAAIPWHDWQFYVVTLAAIMGIAALARALAPTWTGRRKSDSCPTCSSAAPHAVDRVPLTISGKKRA
jgi:hypothetical protein